MLAAEARGFILGAAVARELGAGFVPARKPGKLPHDTVSAEYILEYGVDALEMHADALADGARVLLHDDLLATGGTARALAELAPDRGFAVVARIDHDRPVCFIAYTIKGVGLPFQDTVPPASMPRPRALVCSLAM